MGNGWGPEGRQAAVSFTFDNFGEAAEIEFGSWPESKPIGAHPSVTMALPAILDAIGNGNGNATFFIEGWNLDVYPDEVVAIGNTGHEVASHGFRHEIWTELQPTEEKEKLEAALERYKRHGLDVVGLRPPTSILTPNTIEIVRDLGFTYVSPVRSATGIIDGVAVVPVDFPVADLIYYQPEFAAFRLEPNDAPMLEPEDLVDGFKRSLETTIAGGGYVAVLFHPFQFIIDGELSIERIDAMQQIWDFLSGDERVWFAPCREVADWILERPDRFDGISYEPFDAYKPETFFRDMDLKR